MKKIRFGLKIDWKRIYSVVFPASSSGTDSLVDYLFRVIIFLFPLYTYQTKALMGLSGKDILVGIVVLLLGLRCLYRFIKEKEIVNITSDYRVAFAAVIFLLILFNFGRQFISNNKEMPHTYLYIEAILLLFSSLYINKNSTLHRYYLQLMTASFALVYLSMYRYIFTATATILGGENLLKSPRSLIPLLMLSVLAGSVLYLSEQNDRMQKLYLVAVSAGLVLFFLYGDMMAFCIMMLLIMGLSFIKEPTSQNMKKSIILIFLYGFCASNAPLLTYFEAKGITRKFDLEYSIYIDIVIAVAGLLVSSFWEKMEGKEQDEKDGYAAALSVRCRGIMLIISAVLFIAFIFGSKGAGLQKSVGGKALYGVTNGLWESVKGSSGEIWHVLQVYGVIGVAVLVALMSIALYRVADIYKDPECSEVEKGYLAITVLFLAQSLFYPFSSASLPIYAILVGLALKLAVQEKEVAGELQSDGEIAGKKAAWNLHLQRGAMVLGYITESALAAGLIVLLVAGAYRFINPVDSAGAVESMVQVAIDERQEQLLAAELANAESETITEPEEQGEADEQTGGGIGTIPNAWIGQKTQSDEQTQAEQDVQTESKSQSEQELEEEQAGDDQQIPEEEPEDQEAPAGDPAPGVSGGDYHIYDPKASYATVDEVVTGANGVVNLRSIPSIGADSVVVHPLETGETVTRTAIGENGWSKVNYNGQELYAVTEFLAVYTEPEQQAEEPGQEQEEEAGNEQEAAPEDGQKEQNTQQKSGYSVQWTEDNRKCSIWSAGVLQGTLTITDGEGTPQTITYYGTYNQGSEREQKKYFNLSVPQGDGPPVINVDPGFIAAIKDMGYSGVYLNKQIHNW